MFFLLSEKKEIKISENFTIENMKPLFHTSLINGPFDDPVLYVDFMFKKRALLFDLGDISKLSPRNLIRISHVFVTHTHMDHFIGFDYLIRLLLGRDQTLSLYGPPGIIESVQGRLSGYNWNLVGNYRYPFLLKVLEIHEDHLEEILLVCRKKFAPQDPPKKLAIPQDCLIHRDEQFIIKATALDHKIPSMAYFLKERFHLSVNKEKLKEFGFVVGPWLTKLKNSIYAKKSYNYTIKVQVKDNVREYESGYLKKEILKTTPGQEIGYIVDCDYTPENKEKIIAFMNGVDVLYIESSFLDKDKERARETAHLTAKEAGELARAAGVKKLQVFHFSPKYSGNEQLLIEEAQNAFNLGSVAGDTDHGSEN